MAGDWLITSKVLWAISQEILKVSIFDMPMKNIDLSLQPHLPGASELTYYRTPWNSINNNVNQTFHHHFINDYIIPINASVLTRGLFVNKAFPQGLW